MEEIIKKIEETILKIDKEIVKLKGDKQDLVNSIEILFRTNNVCPDCQKRLLLSRVRW